MCDKEESGKHTAVVSEHEKELAQTALIEFKKKNYNACLQHLNKLDNRNDDFKVLHNKAVVELYKNECRKNETFQKYLNSICNQFKLKIEKLDDVDYCVLYFNQAILYYHQRNYTEAIKIMDRVYKFIEPMEDSLAKQISLFAIELQLCIRQPEKALSLISYIENQLINGTPNIKLLEKAKEKDKKVPPQNDPELEEFRKKLTKYKARCYLMNLDLDNANKEIKLLANTKLNINALFLTASYEYLNGNLEECMKIINSIPKESLVYSETGDSSSVMINNNLGIIHHAMGKFNLACYYYQTALKEDMGLVSNNRKELNEKPLHTLGGSKYHELIYNLGISLLYAGKPAQAFDCLIIAVRRYHKNSRLWMRLAECCIMSHKESNKVDFDTYKELVVDVIGRNDKRKAILTTNLSKDKKYSTESQSYAVPVPSLEFASLCLRNAYTLLPSHTTLSPIPLFHIPGVTPPLPPSNPGASPSSPLTPSAITNLRNAILAASAYVSLCLGDYIIALEHAKNLLAQPKISGVHKLLAHLYCGECLVLLDRIPDALEHFDPENVKDIEFGLTSDNGKESKTNPPTKWFPTTIANAHAVMQYNIAVAKTIRGQLGEAMALLRKVWLLKSGKIPAHIIMLVVYIELQLGHTDVARSLIKQYLFLRKKS